MSDTSRASDAVRDARINEAVAEEVAKGMAEKAEREAVRANLYATHAAQKSDVAEVLRQNTERAQAESRSTKFTLWLVLGIGLIGVIALAAYFMNRPTSTDTAAPTMARPVQTLSTPGSVLVQSNPNPNPTPLRPAPSVARTPIPVRVPVATPVSNMPVRVASPAPVSAPASGNKPLQGYVEPGG